jgi:hypothetical protein
MYHGLQAIDVCIYIAMLVINEFQTILETEAS